MKLNTIKKTKAYKMTKLDKFDLNFCVTRLPKKLSDLMKSEKWNNKIYVGGGFIRGLIAQEKLNDIDLFVQNEADAESIAGLLAEYRSDIHKTDNAYTIKGKLPIQIIHRWVFSRPEDVSNSFDFTVCCAVIFYNNGVWDSFCDSRFYNDLASKRLVYRSPARNEDAGGSMLRVLKYYQRGYRIPLDSLGAIIARLIRDVDFNLIDDGVKNEERVARVITALLREVDPNIDVNHDSHLPSLNGAV